MKINMYIFRIIRHIKKKSQVYKEEIIRQMSFNFKVLSNSVTLYKSTNKAQTP